MNTSVRLTAIIGIILVLGAVMIAVQASTAAPTTSKDPLPPPLDTDGKNTSTGTTPGGSTNGTVIKPNPLPADTPVACYKYQWSDSYKASIAGIASQSTTYQFTTAKNLCKQKGYTEAVAVLAFPADASYAVDELYYSCYKIITVNC